MTYENVSVRKSLKDRARELTTQLPFMAGREKGDAVELIGQYVDIVDYGFMTGDEGHDYAVFIVAQESKHFYFGGMALTDQLHKLDDEGYGNEIRAEGLPVLLTNKKSRNGRTYVNVEFYPA